ncbi:hypothetical protein KRP22_002053 [Phytophthora ramorum]|nr:hypothetical protein KRP22_1336 [Phytophthora ramorum]
MTTASNSSATLLLVTGLLSVSMAAMGYYYLHMSSKKPRALSTDDGEEAGVLEAASLKQVAQSPKKEVQTNLEAPVEKVEEPVVVENTAASPKKEVAASPKEEVAASPKKTPKSSPKKTVDTPKEEEEPPVLDLPKPAHSSPKTAPETPKKEAGPAVIELSKKAIANPIKASESHNKTSESCAQTPESPTKVAESPTKVAESPKKVADSPKKVVESPKKIAEPASDAVARKLSEDFVFTQAVSETATAFTEELLQESLENIALDQEEYVQVELTQSMTLSQSTPELINVEDAAVKNEDEDTLPSAATEDEESIVEEEQDQVAVGSVESSSSEPVVEAAVVPETLAALASPKNPRAPSASWEAITSSPVVKASTPAEEPAAPLSLDTPAESAESSEPLSINVPAETSEAPAENKDTSSPVSSGGSSPGRRNRNRSKKSKSKKKKGKKKFKA